MDSRGEAWILERHGLVIYLLSRRKGRSIFKFSWFDICLLDEASLGQRVPLMMRLLEDASSKGSIVQGTHRPRDTSSKGHSVQGRIVQGHIVQRTEHPRLFVRGHSGRGRNKIVKYVRLRVLDFYVNGGGGGIGGNQRV